MAGVWDLQESITLSGNVLYNQDDYLLTMKKNSTLNYQTAIGTYSGNWLLTNEGKSLRIEYNLNVEEFIIRRLKKMELWLQRPSDGLILKYKNTDK